MSDWYYSLLGEEFGPVSADTIHELLQDGTLADALDRLAAQLRRLMDRVADALDDISASGNPAAQPLMSWNADVSLEWYANADSMLSTAVYYKQFNGGSVPVVVGENFDIDGVSVTVPVEQLATSDQKSDLFGVEFTASHSFSYLPGIFSGLGVKASYNYAHSNFKTEDLRLGESTDPITGVFTPGIVEPANIFGLSKHVASAQVYWGLGKLDLVTREEFDVQRAVLLRTREKLDALEQRLAELADAPQPPRH